MTLASASSSRSAYLNMLPSGDLVDPQNDLPPGEYEPRTFVAYLEYLDKILRLGHEISEQAVGFFLSLDPRQVRELKSVIRHVLRVPVNPRVDKDIYYLHDASSNERPELLCKKGGVQLGWHLAPGPCTTLIRSNVVFEVVLALPHLFKEPASNEEFYREWLEAGHDRYSSAPYPCRQDILVRLIDICAEEMKRDKTLRLAATDPIPYESFNPSPEDDEPSSNRPRTGAIPSYGSAPFYGAAPSYGPIPPYGARVAQLRRPWR